MAMQVGVRPGVRCGVGECAGAVHCRCAPVPCRGTCERRCRRLGGPQADRVSRLVWSAGRVGWRPDAGLAHRHERPCRPGAPDAGAICRAGHLRHPRCRSVADAWLALGERLRGHCPQCRAAGVGAGRWGALAGACARGSPIAVARSRTTAASAGCSLAGHFGSESSAVSPGRGQRARPRRRATTRASGRACRAAGDRSAPGAAAGAPIKHRSACLPWPIVLRGGGRWFLIADSQLVCGLLERLTRPIPAVQLPVYAVRRPVAFSAEPGLLPGVPAADLPFERVGIWVVGLPLGRRAAW